jgi:FkbM family methyltransferase
MTTRGRPAGVGGLFAALDTEAGKATRRFCVLMTEDTPLRVRIQFAVTKSITRTLKWLGLRDTVMSLRLRGRRGLRRLFERAGSDRLSRPALHGMDAKLDELFARDGGTFVEAGGFDGYTQSNTYYLEHFRRWRGILVEPMPELAAEARLNRAGARVFQCALVADDYEGEAIEMDFGDLWSAVRGVHADDWAAGGVVLGWRDRRIERVPVRTLSGLLDEAGIPEVDLLSLDVEGYEAQALRGLDLERHAPKWILVEMHDLAAGRAEIGPLLGERYVEHEQLSPVDVLYRRRDVEPPAARKGSDGVASR